MMAEFQKVMEQFARLCDTYSNKGCNGCPVESEGFNCDSIHQGFSKSGAEELEAVIMDWAAEYPEPVYPTWFEFLLMNGAIGVKSDNYTIGELVRQYRIPADIAEKLGIEPKEGAN